MKRARDLVMIVAIVLLGGGYLLSQIAAYNGTASAVAARLDGQPMRILAAVLLVVTLVLAFMRDPKESL